MPVLRFMALPRSIPRRHFLRGAGITLGLPMLDAMQPLPVQSGNKSTSEEIPRRMFAICNNLGLLESKFFPKQAGKDYEFSPYLNVLREYRNDFTVFSGVSHPDVDGSHASECCFLTDTPHPANGGLL